MVRAKVLVLFDHWISPVPAGKVGENTRLKKSVASVLMFYHVCIIIEPIQAEGSNLRLNLHSPGRQALWQVALPDRTCLTLQPKEVIACFNLRNRWGKCTSGPLILQKNRTGTRTACLARISAVAVGKPP